MVNYMLKNFLKNLLCNTPQESDQQLAKQLPQVKRSYITEFKEHLKLREGVIYAVYRDSLGKLTAGVGHLLPKDSLYCVGQLVTKEQVDTWLALDSQKAWDAAGEQLGLLGLEENTEFHAALASVNFQLGVNWYKFHKKTWHYMMQGEYEVAAVEVYDSNWHKQTPVRVDDFSLALEDLAYA